MNKPNKSKSEMLSEFLNTHIKKETQNLRDLKKTSQSTHTSKTHLNPRKTKIETHSVDRSVAHKDVKVMDDYNYLASPVSSKFKPNETTHSSIGSQKSFSPNHIDENDLKSEFRDSQLEVNSVHEKQSLFSMPVKNNDKSNTGSQYLENMGHNSGYGYQTQNDANIKFETESMRSGMSYNTYPNNNMNMHSQMMPPHFQPRFNMPMYPPPRPMTQPHDTMSMISIRPQDYPHSFYNGYEMNYDHMSMMPSPMMNNIPPYGSMKHSPDNFKSQNMPNNGFKMPYPPNMHAPHFNNQLIAHHHHLARMHSMPRQMKYEPISVRNHRQHDPSQSSAHESPSSQSSGGGDYNRYKMYENIDMFHSNKDFHKNLMPYLNSMGINPMDYVPKHEPNMYHGHFREEVKLPRTQSGVIYVDDKPVLQNIVST